MKRETVDIVEELVEGLELSVKINSITDNGDSTYTIETCNTSYLFPCFKFDINGVTYTVIDEVGKEFEFNVRFTIKGNVIPTVEEFTLPDLKYFHGTVIATKAELDRKQFDTDKYPMVYLLEVLRDSFKRLDRDWETISNLVT